MSFLARVLAAGAFAAALVTAPAALGAPEPSEGKRISVQFRGPLKDALRKIASEGGVNLVVLGDLSEPADVHLEDATAEEVLQALVAAYRLELERDGKIWMIRKAGAGEAEAPAAPVPPAPAEAPQATPVVDRGDRSERAGEGERVGTGPVVVEPGQVVERAVSFGGTVTVGEGAVVEEDAIAFGGDVVLEAGALVEGDAVSFGGQVRKAPGAMVEGKEVAMGAPGLGVVAKQLKHVKPEPVEEDSPRSGIRLRWPHSGALSGFLLRFALLFGLGFLFSMFVPSRMRQLEREVKQAAVRCGLTGLVGGFLLLPLTVLLVVTIIGIPFALALWVFTGLGIAMGVAAVASEVGLRVPVLRARKTQAAVLALGLLVLLGVAQIPVLGPIVMTTVTAIALGAIIRTRFGQRNRGIPEPDPFPSEPTAVR